jgi:hypothetical protein
MYNEGQSAGTEQVLQEHLEKICKLAHSGFLLEDISFALNIDIQTVHLIIGQDPNHKSRVAQQLRTQDLQALQLYEDTLPTFIYSYKMNTNQLHRTNPVTAEQSSHPVPLYQFKSGCCWSEVPGGSLLITGGGYPTAVREVVRIDTRRELAASQCPPMFISRRLHTSVYHTQHLYVLGGFNLKHLSECERFICAEQRWEALPALPRACHSMSGVVLERSLYALGGYDGSTLDLVQKLSLESLTWELMQFRLPDGGRGIPSFKLRDTEVYLVINKTLCLFTALQVLPLRPLTESIFSWFGASYYRRGVLYCSNYEGPALRHQIDS